MEFNSVAFWRARYEKGQNSGSGSYGAMAEFKAEAFNEFVKLHQIHSCCEFGVGDGNQLGYLKVPQFLGLDVAPAAIDLCIAKFADDASKSFMVYDPGYFVNNGAINVDLGLSMDVILHLIEDQIYDSYMRNLCAASNSYLAIFNTASDTQLPKMAVHNKYRDHRLWLSKNAPEFKELCVALCPAELGYPAETGFYFYKK